tara:strand:+ start:47 stop:1213 length:1167 start_codon:yes stop_codon:yes gene_type:complete
MKIEALIVKHFSNKLNSSELKTFLELLEKKKNKKLFKKRIREQYDISLVLQNEDLDKEFERVLQRIKQSENKQIVRRFKWVQIAAVFVGLMSMTYFLHQYLNKTNTIVNDQILEFNEASVVLELENGTQIQLLDNENKSITNEDGSLVSTQVGTALNYQESKQVEKQTLIFNTLKVPNGKRFQLLLSDGSEVQLNAGSSLRYPVQFIEGMHRDVYVDGEAYFKVKKDKKHPFVVHTNEQNIRVLGTEFNVSSYPEDFAVNTVLVEGSVSIYNANTNYKEENIQLLKPGFKSSWNKETAQVTFESVDTKIYTSWIDGKLIFQNTPFSVLRKKIERHFNVTIKNNNPGLDAKTYTINFDKENIYQVMELFSKMYEMKYSIINNAIVIEKP